MPPRIIQRRIRYGRLARRKKKGKIPVGKPVSKEQCYKMPVDALAKALQHNVHTFVRYCAGTTLSVGIVGTAQGYQYKFDDLVNFTEFENLFDYYRIMKINIKFVPIRQINVSRDISDGSSAAFYVPTVYHCIDTDDAGTPTVDSLKQRSDVMTTSANKQFEVSWIPRITNEVFNSVSTTGYALSPAGTWCDMAYHSIPHYGFKIATTGTGAANVTFEYDVQIRYVVQCKGLL